MIKTSTPELKFTVTPKPTTPRKKPVPDVPNDQVLLNILNFSKNLELLPSTMLGSAMVLKS